MKRSALTVLASLTVCCIVFYCFQVRRPVNLISSTVSDGPEYIAIAHQIEQGKLSGFKSRNTALPIGYPLLIAGCDRVGLNLGALNFLCLAIALAASWFVLRRGFGLSMTASWFILLLVAGSDVCRELSVTVASEMAFFAASMVAMMLMECGTFPALLLAIPACVAAILIRTAGVALLLALAWAIAVHPLIRPWITRRALAMAIIMMLLAAFALCKTEYVSSVISGRYNIGTDWHSIATQQGTKLSALGELATSQRAEDFRMSYQSEFGFLGAILLALMAVGFWSRRGPWRPTDIYVLAYFGVLFVYPFFGFGPERRFLFPVLPLIAAIVWSGGRHLLHDRALLKTRKGPA